MEVKIKSIIENIIYKRHGYRVILQNDSNLNDIGLDSLDFMVLLYDIEEAFLIKIPKEYNTYTYNTVQDVIDVAYKIRKELEDDVLL